MKRILHFLRSFPRRYWIFFSYLLASIIVYWPLALHLRDHLPWDRGDPLFIYVLLDWTFRHFPFHWLQWENPNFYYPLPNVIYYSDLLIGQWMLYAPLRLLLGNALAAMNGVTLLAPALGGWGGFLLARAYGVKHPLAAWIAGFLCALSTPFVGQLGHFQLNAVAALSWIYLAWLKLVTPARRQRYWALGVGLGLGLLFLSSVYVFYMAALSLILHCLYRLVRRQVLPAWRQLLAIGLIFGVVAGYFAWRYDGQREDLGPEKYTAYSVHAALGASDFRRVTPGTHNLWEWVGLTRPGEVEKIAFPGWVGVGLILGLFVGLIIVSFSRKEKQEAGAAAQTPTDDETIWLFLWLAIAVSLALGPYPFGLRGLRWVSPFHALKAIVPGFGVIRAPGRFMLLAMLPFGLLAGRALDYLLRQKRGRWLGCGLAALAVIEHLPFGVPLAPAGDLNDSTIAPCYRQLMRENLVTPVVLLDFPETTLTAIQDMLSWDRHDLSMTGGYTGRINDYVYLLQTKLQNLPVADWPAFLRQHIITDMVIHPSRLENPRQLKVQLQTYFAGRVRFFDAWENGGEEMWVVMK